MPIKIFISHSARDEPLASAVVDCLFSCMVLQDDEVRCTSVPGHKLAVGSDFAGTLRNDLGNTSVVVGLVTRNALSSSWVLFELGATWGAKKNLMPLVSDDIEIKELPGPLSGQHVARLSNRSDLSQFVQELTNHLSANARASAKIDTAIGKLVADHGEYAKAQSKPPTAKITKTKPKEPTIAGMPFSELMTVLNNEKLDIPENLTNEDAAIQRSLFELFVSHAQQFSAGIQSNRDKGSAGDFLYREVGLRLLTYGLVRFEKLPAKQAMWFKRLEMSPDGNKFILHFKRLTSGGA